MQQAIVTQLGWRSLRPVQEVSIPPLLAGHDAVVLAPTAGGKTESAMLPLLDRLLADGHKGEPAILYLCPLKALINNLLPRLQSLARMAGLDAFAWHGEVTATARKSFLKEPQSILLTTPESLQVILSRSHLDAAELFAGLQSVVIDEVHAFAGEARGDQLMALLHQLDHWCGRSVQRVGLSATVGNPEDLLTWLSGDRGQPQSLIDPNSVSSQKSRRMLEVHPVGEDSAECAELLSRLMRASAKSLLFVDSRRQAEEIRGQLAQRGVEALAHHSSLSQELREQSEAVFKKQGGNNRLPQTIVCTSTLELGLDVGDVDKVFQLGAPSTVSAFLQRFGRAGRRDGAVAHMIFVTDLEDSFLRAVALIQLALNKKVEPVCPDRRAFQVLIQQILLVILKHGAIAPDKMWALLGTPPSFADITDDEKKQILHHLLEQEWLLTGQGRLRIGDRTEKAFGRSHFMELLSIFEGGSSVTVKTLDARPVGTLDSSVAHRLWSERSSFLLGGGSWLPKSWDERAKVLTVTPSVGGEVVRWSGSRSELSFALARQVRQLLTETDSPAFLGPKAAEHLQKLRGSFSYLDGERPLIWEKGRAEQKSICVELWAGQAIHRTLADSLAGWLGCESSADERKITLQCDPKEWEALMKNAPWTEAAKFLESGLAMGRQQSGASVDEDAKFANLLPDELRKELIQRKKYDLLGASQVFCELAHCLELDHAPKA